MSAATQTQDAPLRKRDLAIPFVQRELLIMYDFTGIRQARANFPGRTREEVFERLRRRYNAGLIRHARREQRHVERRAAFDARREAAKEQRRIAREQHIAAARRASGIQRTAGHVHVANQRHVKREFKSAGGTFHQADHVVSPDGNITQNDVEHQIRDELVTYFNKRPPGMLMLANVIVTYIKERDDDPDIEMHFHRAMFEAFRSLQFLEDYVVDYMQRLAKHIEDGEKGPSGYRFKHIALIRVQTKYVNPPRGGTFIDLPPAIKNKKCCVNIKSDDNRCFDYAILAHYHHDEIGRLANRTDGKYYHQFIGRKIQIPEGIIYPVSSIEIKKYEDLNNIKIVVYILGDDNKPQVLYNRRSCAYDADKDVIPLLLLHHADGQAHYVLIRSMSRLLGSKEHDDNGAKHYCLHCLCARYSTKEELNAHIEICVNNEGVRCVLPKEGKNLLSFRNHGRKHRHPFYVTADFESTLEKMHEVQGGGCIQTQRHVPNSFALKFCSRYEQYNQPVEVYTASNKDELMRMFIERLESMALHAHTLQLQHRYFNKTMEFRQSEQYAAHCSAVRCDDCDKLFDDMLSGAKKCLHHDHITGAFIGTICESCNLAQQQRRFLPVYMHNAKGYRLRETMLPPKDAFYSSLTQEGCSDDDYDRAQFVWHKFGCKTFWDYHQLYLKSDTLLLADIWAEFTDVCHRIYGLDACYYYTSPGLSWDAMLKHSAVNLELLTDMDMYLMFEGALRGGLSQISKRYAKANNPAMG